MDPRVQVMALPATASDKIVVAAVAWNIASSTAVAAISQRRPAHVVRNPACRSQSVNVALDVPAAKASLPISLQLHPVIRMHDPISLHSP